MDISNTIVPRSDQLNAEDLLTGPRTFTVDKVSKGSAEQPVDVHLVESPGRPFRPSKTVRRILVAAWGPDAAAYAGRRMTLYRDPDVKFGGLDVGGIRVSHLSHIDKPLTLALTVTRGKRQAYVVQPLTEAPPARADGVDRAQLSRIGELMADLGIEGREASLAYAAKVIGRDIDASTDLTRDEAALLIARMESSQGGDE